MGRNIGDKKLRTIHFDFDTNKLKEIYPNKYYNQAYDDVQRFLTANGFEHRQCSGYKSIVTMTSQKCEWVIDEMFQKYPWMEACLNKVDIAVLEENYDFLKKYRKEHKILDPELEKDMDLTMPALLDLHENAVTHEEPELKKVEELER